MGITELQWITYLSFVALAIVSYLYIRQRNENNQRAQSVIRQDDYSSVVSKPTGFMSKSYPGPGPNLPTFSPQEAFERKNLGEINRSQINQRDSRGFSSFGGGNVSHFNPATADKGGDKSFEEYRRYMPYEPSQEISASRASFKQDQNDRNKPQWSKIETSITQISTQQDPYDANRDILYAQTQPQVSQVEEEQPTPGDRWNNTRTLDGPDLENEYKVFRDFKLREGRSFHDEPKRDESPLRANSKKLSGLDRVGHSPDSPFKMFESPAIGTNSKKKMTADAAKPTKQQQNLLSKKDSFTRTQEALNQKAKPQVRTVPHNQRSAKILADQKNERRARLNQVFIDNNSEDEMHVEEQKDPSMKNKRPATDTRSFDKFEKETSNKKVLKTNDQQAKVKPFERKNVPLRGNYQLESYQKKEQKPTYNKQSSVDLSYMSEYAANPSLKKYVQMKTRQDETTKSKPSTPITNIRGMNVEKSPRQAVSPKVDKGPYRAPSSLARKEETPVGSKKLTSNGSHAAPKSEPKQEKTLGTTQQKSDNDANKGLFGNGNKLSSLPKDTNVKPEGAKISSIIGGSSLFTQPKSEAAPTLGDEETKTSKFGATEKAPQQTSTGQGSAFDMFKTIRPGAAAGSSKESDDKPQILSKKNEESQDPPKQSSLFSNPKSDEKPQDQNPKSELKGLFPSSGGGLFSNLSNASQNKSSTETAGTGLFGNKEIKETEQKQPSSAFSSLGSAPKSNDKEEEKPKAGLFGSLITPVSGGGSGSLSVNSAFGNANKEAEKKDNPLAPYSKQPEAEAAEDTKPKGLFANPNSSFGSLFKTAGESSGGGSLFSGLNNKDGGKSIGGGLFSNLNK